MKIQLTPIISGLLFGLGLAYSGMTDPNKVLDFLDIFGQWDMSLMFVMASALAITFISFHFILKRKKPVAESKFQLPTNVKIDTRLLSGAALFGIGWGLIGYCPGPAVASIAYGYWQPVLFIIAAIAGNLITKKVL